MLAPELMVISVSMSGSMTALMASVVMVSVTVTIVMSKICFSIEIMK